MTKKSRHRSNGFTKEYDCSDKKYRLLFSKELTKDLFDLRASIVNLKAKYLVEQKEELPFGKIDVNYKIRDTDNFMRDLEHIINKRVADSLKWKFIHAFFGANSTLKKLYTLRTDQVIDLVGPVQQENYLLSAGRSNDGKILTQKTPVGEFVDEGEMESLFKNHPDIFLPEGVENAIYGINQVKYFTKTNKVITEEYRQKRIGRFGEKISDYLFGIENNLPSDLLGQRVEVPVDLLKKTVAQFKELADDGSYYPEWIEFNKKDSVKDLRNKANFAVSLNDKYSGKDPSSVTKEDRFRMLPRVEIDFFLRKYPVQTLVQEQESGFIYKNGIISHENFYYSFRSNHRNGKYSESGLSKGARYVEDLVLYMLDKP